MARPFDTAFRLSHTPGFTKCVLSAAVVLAALLPTSASSQLSVTGRWTPFTSPIGHESIHTVLMRGANGYHTRILSWGYTPYSSPDRARLWGWNPSTGTTENDCSTFPLTALNTLPLSTTGIPNLYCSGHTMLADGRLLITGGHDEANSIGLRQSMLFDPTAPTSTQWIPQPVMQQERWYPTQTTLPDGSILSVAGTRFMHAIVFGGTESPEDPTVPSHGELRPLGLNTIGRWMPTVSTDVVWPDPVEGQTSLWSAAWSEVVMFGGRNGNNGPTNRTWKCHIEILNGDLHYNWKEITATAPAARSRHTSVIRTVGGVDHMVVFGGLGAGGTALGDVQDLTYPNPAWVWTALPSIGSPGPRYGHTAIYDKARDRMLVFGGLTAPGVLADNEVYAYSFTNNTWTQINLAGKPEAREGHSLVLDPSPRAGPFSSADQRAILFGGNTGTPQNDAWVLWISGINGDLQWQSLGTISGAPAGGLTRHAAMWDETQAGTGADRMVVIGGEDGSGTVAGAWVLDSNLTTWTPLTSPDIGLAGATATFYLAGIIANYPEVYTPPAAGQSVGTWHQVNAPRWQQNYPFMFVLPSGNVFNAGPDPASSKIDPRSATPAWSPLPATPGGVTGACAVMYEPGKVMKCGTQINPTHGLTAKIEIDAADNTTGWVTLASQMKPRSYHNLTMLPNGKVLLTGGLQNSGSVYDMNNLPVKDPEIWDPATGQWSGLGVLAPDPARRGYHSTVMLLPDGRILSAGGEPGVPWLNPDYEEATIFCPPYLFNPDGSLASRPSITSSYRSIGYGGTFTLLTPDNPVSSVCLIRPSAVTHAFNEDQRYMKLSFVPDYAHGRLQVSSPSDANVAPPGDYMLFINKVNPATGQEVPSIAWWVRIADGVWLDAVPGPTPPRFALEQNHPNPFGGSTAIGFALPTAQTVIFDVFDAAGRRVFSRDLGEVPAGRNRLDWNTVGTSGKPMSAGVYLYQITAGTMRERKKMVLLGR